MVRKSKYVKLTFLILILVLAFNQVSVRAENYLPHLTVTPANLYMTAGQENEMEIKLGNPGTFSVYELRATLSPPAGVPGISVLSGAQKIYNKIENSTSKTYRPVIYIDKNTPLGAYSMTLTLMYVKRFQLAEFTEVDTVQIGFVVQDKVEPNIDIDAFAMDVSLTAGADNTLGVSLSNIGEEDVYEVDASISSVSPYIAVLANSRLTYDQLKVNSSILHIPTVRVSRNAPLGVYTLTETVTYKDATGQSHMGSYTLGFKVDSISQPDVKLNMELANTGLTAGINNPMTVSVENIGGEGVYDVDAILVSTNPYVIVLKGGRYIDGDMEPGEVASFSPVLTVSRSAPFGVYTVTSTVTYRDAEGQNYMETFTLGITVESVQIKAQTSVVLTGYGSLPEVTHPGDSVTMNLDLTCLGARAYDVKAKLMFDPLTGISALSPTLVALGDLQPGESAEASYEIILDGGLRAGQYPASLTLSYLDDEGMPKSLMESLTLSVRGIVGFALINTEGMMVTPGSVSTLKVDLLLIGTESIQFMDIEVVEDDVFRKTSGSLEYIGAVDPDSPIPFDLDFEVAEDADEGGHTLTLRVRYTDDLNQEHEETLEVDLDVETPSDSSARSQASGGGFWTWLRRLLGLGP